MQWLGLYFLQHPEIHKTLASTTYVTVLRIDFSSRKLCVTSKAEFHCQTNGEFEPLGISTKHRTKLTRV